MYMLFLDNKVLKCRIQWSEAERHGDKKWGHQFRFFGPFGTQHIVEAHLDS